MVAWHTESESFVIAGPLVIGLAVLFAVATALGQGPGVQNEQVGADFVAMPLAGGPSVVSSKTNSPAALSWNDMPIQTQHSRFSGDAEALGGGRTCATATQVSALPFFDTGNTCGRGDDYDEICPHVAPGSPDVVYSYLPPRDMTVSISLCGNSAYDTKLYVYQNACPAPGGYYTCNDDACSTSSFPLPYVSRLSGVNLVGGKIYYIVVDGYGGDCGFYSIVNFSHFQASS